MKSFHETKIYYAISKQRKAGEAILITEKKTKRQKYIIRDNRYFIVVKV